VEHLANGSSGSAGSSGTSASDHQEVQDWAVVQDQRKRRIKGNIKIAQMDHQEVQDRWKCRIAGSAGSVEHPISGANGSSGAGSGGTSGVKWNIWIDGKC
jgi:hypothetical protein